MTADKGNVGLDIHKLYVGVNSSSWNVVVALQKRPGEEECFISLSVTFAAHYCSRISALNSTVCSYKTQEAPEKKSIKDTSFGNGVRTYGINVWILSLCYTSAHKPFILFHTFIYFQSHRYNLTCQLHRSGVWHPPGGGLQQLFRPNSCHYFKLDQQIHLQQFCKMEGHWNEFLLKVNSDFSGSRQYLKFRDQLLQKLQKLEEHRFLGGYLQWHCRQTCNSASCRRKTADLYPWCDMAITKWTVYTSF